MPIRRTKPSSRSSSKPPVSVTSTATSTSESSSSAQPTSGSTHLNEPHSATANSHSASHSPSPLASTSASASGSTPAPKPQLQPQLQPRSSRPPSIFSTTTTASSSRRAPASLRIAASASRKASNPHLSLIYASAEADPSLTTLAAESSSSTSTHGTRPGLGSTAGRHGNGNDTGSRSTTGYRSEAALSRQLDGDLGGRQMGLRSRRSSTATVQTIRTVREDEAAGGAGGAEGSISPSIREEEEEAAQMPMEGQGEASTSTSRLHPGAGRSNSERRDLQGERTESDAESVATISRARERDRACSGTVNGNASRLNPKASSSWLRWNATTPGFPKANSIKGKGKEVEARPPGVRSESSSSTGVEAQLPNQASTQENQASDTVAKPRNTVDRGDSAEHSNDGQTESQAGDTIRAGAAPVQPPPNDRLASPANQPSSVKTPMRARGWWSRTTPVPMPKAAPETKPSAELAKPPIPISQAEPAPQPTDPASSQQSSQKEQPPAGPTEKAAADPVTSNEGIRRPESEQAGQSGWRSYMTWRSSVPTPTSASGGDKASINTTAIRSRTPSIQATPKEHELSAPKAGPTESAQAQPTQPTEQPMLVSPDGEEPPQLDPVPPSTQEAASMPNPQPTSGWGSFLYSIVIPQVGPPASATPVASSSSATVIAPSPDVEQKPVAATSLPVSSVSPSDPADPPIESPSGAIAAEPDVVPKPKEEGVPPAASTIRESSAQASSTGWLNYLAFRAAQKKLPPAGSTKTSETAAPRQSTEEVMDFSSDPDFPPGPATSTTNKQIANAANTETESSSLKDNTMKPPTNLPRKKRLSNASNRSASSTVPIPPSPRPRSTIDTISAGTTPKQTSALPPPPAVPAVQPNLVLPSFSSTFDRPPRSLLPLAEERQKPSTPAPAATTGLAWRALGAVGSYVYGSTGDTKASEVETEKVTETRGMKEGRGVGDDLPRRVGLNGGDPDEGWKEVKRVVVIGVHGWFPAKMLNPVIGEPTGTSVKFANMMGQAVTKFFSDRGVEGIRLTLMPLEGDGIIDHRVDKLYKAYLSNPSWINDLRRADAIFVAAHSQGCIATTHLLSRLIAQGHIRTPHNAEAVSRCEWAFGHTHILPPEDSPRQLKGKGHPHKATTVPITLTGAEGGYQKVCLLAMCGVHLGPLYSISTSTVIQPYLQWFENAAARELFEFQDSTSAVSLAYQRALAMCLENDVRVVLLSSMNDQVVPIYGASFSAATHPLLLRALFVDGPSHTPATEYMTKLLAFAFMLRNAGISDQRLIEHLSEATAGSLTGLGHSTPYEEPQVYALAVDYLFLAGPARKASSASPLDSNSHSKSNSNPDHVVNDNGVSAALGSTPLLEIEHFSARDTRNDFELPWIMRALVDAPEVKDLFPQELKELKEGVVGWRPVTKALKDIKKRLEPMAPRQSRLRELAHATSNSSLNGGDNSGAGGGVLKNQPVAGLKRDW